MRAGSRCGRRPSSRATTPIPSRSRSCESINMDMQTIILDQPGQLRLITTPAPDAPGPGEALVRVHRVGVCGTDIHAFYGRQPFFSYPRILGHELGVEVVELGPGVDSVRPGDRCAVEPYLNCGACVACRRGRPNCSDNLG